MADELEIRAPTPADVPALGKLYEVVKGRPRPESVTRHRLFDTPWGDSVALIALDGDVCASMAVFWPVAMRVGDDVVHGAQGMEAVTHPDYRGRPRLFLTIARQGRDLALERGVELLYTFPNVRSIKLTKHVGATYLGEVGGWGIDLERRRIRVPGLARRRKEVAAAPPTTEELAAFAAEVHAERGVVRTDKSAAWLSWRYSDATCENYEWLALRDAAGSLTAAALLGERDPESWGPDFAGIVRILELLAQDEEAAQSLLRLAVDHVRRGGARKLDILVKDPVLERAVGAAGFRLEHRHPITTRAHEARRFDVDTYDFDRWRLISGDHDFF